MKPLQLTLLALLFSVSSFALVPITGPSSVCVGSTIVLLEPSIIVLISPWSSSDVTIATVTPTTGHVTGVSAGVVTITYTQGTMYVTKDVTVNPLPSNIVGSSLACVGTTTSLADVTPGGAWSSSPTTVATIGSTGIVNTVGPGTVTFTYTLPTGCFVTATMTVEPSSSPIIGPTSICSGSSATLTDAVTGGTWSSSAPGTATIGSSSGVVMGITPGTTTISYASSGGCFTATMTMTVVPGPGPITGPSAVCDGGTITLSDAGGGTWSSSDITVATVGAGTGIVTGVGIGVVSITYSLGAGCYVTKPVTVNGIPVCTVTGGGPYCSGGTGVHIGLSCSTPGISYQLFSGASPVGGPVLGTGGALDFGLMLIPGVYTVTAIDPLTGCSRNMTGSVTITINPLPPACTVTGGGSFCAGGAGVLVGLSCSSTGVNYQLYNGTTMVGTAMPGTGLAINFGPEITAGTYTVVATDAVTGCTSNMTSSAVITVNPLPSAIAGTATVCIAQTTTLTDPTIGGTWSSSNLSLATVGSTTGIVTGVAAGTVTMTYTVSATGCSVTTTVTVHALPCSTGVPANSIPDMGLVTVYPNPAADELTLYTNKGVYNAYFITNMQGQTIMNDHVIDIVQKIDISNLPAGLYYILLKGDSGSRAQKFVKI